MHTLHLPCVLATLIKSPFSVLHHYFSLYWAYSGECWTWHVVSQVQVFGISEPCFCFSFHTFVSFACLALAKISHSTINNWGEVASLFVAIRCLIW
jgi:hypothetical protein